AGVRRGPEGKWVGVGGGARGEEGTVGIERPLQHLVQALRLPGLLLGGGDLLGLVLGLLVHVRLGPGPALRLEQQPFLCPCCFQAVAGARLFGIRFEATGGVFGAGHAQGVRAAVPPQVERGGAGGRRTGRGAAPPWGGSVRQWGWRKGWNCHPPRTTPCTRRGKERGTSSGSPAPIAGATWFPRGRFPSRHSARPGTRSPRSR